MKLELQALAGLIRKGRRRQVKQLALCGRCPFYSWEKKGCISSNCALLAPTGRTRPFSNIGESAVIVSNPEPLPERGENEGFREWLHRATSGRKPSQMDPLHLKDSEKGKGDSSRLTSTIQVDYDGNPGYNGSFWSTRFPSPLSEERRIFLWNSHILEKEREFAALKEDDLFRQAVEAVLKAHGVSFPSDDGEVSGEEDVAVEEAVQSIDHVVEALTTAVKELKTPWKSTRQSS